jgi:hypothetical protein
MDANPPNGGGSDHTKTITRLQLQTITNEEQHKSQREERRRKREEATKSMPQVDVKIKSAKNTKGNTAASADTNVRSSGVTTHGFSCFV